MFISFSEEHFQVTAKSLDDLSLNEGFAHIL